MLKVYCYEKCGTCRKALKWLKEHDIAHEVIDIAADHPDEQAIRKFHALSGLTLKRFFNTSGRLYRELELTKRLPGMGEDEQYALLASDGMLVKRPLAVDGDKVLVGFNEDEWAEKLT